MIILQLQDSFIDFGIVLDSLRKTRPSDRSRNKRAMKGALCFLLWVVCVLGKNNVCPPNSKCKCTESDRDISLDCDGVTNMKQLKGLFDKNTGVKGTINNLRLDQCNARYLPGEIFLNASIKTIISTCPFDQLDDDALSNVESLKKLRLTSTEFSTIPRAISKLQKLELLNVNGGKLTEIGTELQNMTNLKELELRRNEISSGHVAKGAFSGSRKLETVDLSENGLGRLHPGTFDECRKLSKVFLQSNKLTSIDNLFTIPYLKEINLKDNNLTSIDNAFQHDLELETLNLGLNPLKQIKDTAFNLSVRQLITLILQRCQLAYLSPLLFRHLTKLQKLDLSFNMLQTLPIEIFTTLNNLLEIDLKENQIRYLGDVFNQNYRLKKIVLSGNRLESCGNIFHDLQSLETVDLRENNLEVITNSDFSTSPSIQYLFLSKNKIRLIESNAFIYLVQLQNLTLNNNRLESLNQSVQNMPELHSLKLHFNQLTVIKKSELMNLPNLKLLNLASNYLCDIEGAFRNLDNLESLTITLNRLKTLSRNTFPKVIRIKKISASGNKWTCNCSLLWLLEWIMSSNLIRKENQFECSAPARFKMKSLSQLTPEQLTTWPENCDSLCFCTCVPKDNTYFIKVDCSNRNLTTVPTALPYGTGELHLQDNNLTNPIELNIHSLELMNVERNFLNKIDFYLPKNLETLMLAGNNLTRFPSYFPPSVSTWTLSNNPWICDCEANHFRKFLGTQGSKIKDLHRIKCSDTEGKPQLYGRLINEITEFEMCPEKLRAYILIGVGLSVTTLMAIVAHLVYSRYRYHLKVWLYFKGFSWLKKGDNRDDGKLHDAYLSFSDMDLEFAREHIIPELEDKEPFYSLFVPLRDMQAGRFEIEQQIQELENSKRIIILLSQHYVDNELCMEIFRTAFTSCLEEKMNRIIFISVGTLPPVSELDPTLKVAIESIKSLKFGQRLFWEMVRFAMPVDNRREDEFGMDSDIDMPLLKA